MQLLSRQIKNVFIMKKCKIISLKLKNSIFLLILLLCSIGGFSQITFNQHLITDEFTKGTDVYVYDINGDNHKDMVSVSKRNSGELCWWENDGFRNFTEHSIRQDFNGARSVRAADINHDDKVDIVAAAWIANDIIWWENDGNENFTEHIIDNNFIGAHTVDIKDVNDDGHNDVLCSGFDYYGHEGEIAWWENDGEGNFIKHLISTRFHQSPFIYGEDMDEDNDLDIIACGELNDEVLWWENDGDENFTEHLIDNNFDAAHTVIAKDINKDGYMDILGAACMSGKLAWWENNINQDFIKHNLGSFPGALWLDATDIDNDNDIDLVGAGMGSSRLAWWENDGNQNFTKLFFNESFSSAFCLSIADIDNDNDDDITAIGYNSNKISWFENSLLQPNIYDHPECVVYDYLKKRYFISNATQNNTGNIVEIDSTEKVSYYFTNLETPLGMCIKDNILYVSDAKKALLGFDLDSKENVMELNIPMIGNLDGMACDNSGNLFVIDTYGRIYRVNIQQQTYNLFVNGGLGTWPQDCIFDEPNNRLIVAGWGANASIRGISLEDSTITNIVDNTIGYFDGITKDQYNNIYVASHNGGKILRYENTFTSPPEIISSGHQGPAGINYNTEDNVLAIPNYNSSQVDFIDVSVSSINNIENQLIKTSIFPNPFYKETIIQFDLPSSSKVTIEIYNLAGNLIKNVSQAKLFPAGLNKITWDGSNEKGKKVCSGEYLCKVVGTNFKITKKLVLLR